MFYKWFKMFNEYFKMFNVLQHLVSSATIGIAALVTAHKPIAAGIGDNAGKVIPY